MTMGLRRLLFPLVWGALVVLDQAANEAALWFQPSGIGKGPVVRNPGAPNRAEDFLTLGALTAAFFFFTLFGVLSGGKQAPPGARRFQPGLVILTAGLGSNLVDRFFRPGGPVDFLRLPGLDGFAFNLADGEIVIGGLVLVAVFFRKE